MNRLCIVPARGGSKRLPGKNIKMLGDKPLVCHTIETVKDCFEKVILTSDDIDIIRVVEKFYPSISMEVRPPELATDTSKVIDTVLHYARESCYKDFDQVWLALPTCPLRSKEDVEEAQKLLTTDIDSVISTTDYEFPPGLGLLEGAEGLLVGYDYRHPFAAGNSRSQDQQRVFRPNGALYGAWASSLLEYKNFYKGKVRGCFMPRERSIDIDTDLEFLLAETILNRK